MLPVRNGVMPSGYLKPGAKFSDDTDASGAARSRGRAIILAIVAAAIFYAVTGYGVLHNGFNPDDWRLSVRNIVDIWLAEGRWGFHLIFQYLLQGEYRLPLQLTLAFFCFASISWILAVDAAADAASRQWFALFIFIAGVNFIYMADALNFDFAVLAFPLSLLCSLAAFRLLIRVTTAKTTWPIRAVLALAAIQLLALSLSIYEPFVFFGAILPVLALIRSDRFTLRTAVGLLVLSVGLLLFAIALHRVEWSLIVPAEYRSTEVATFLWPVGLLDRLNDLPIAIRRILAGSLLSTPIWLKVPLFAIALTAGAAPALAAYIRARGEFSRRSTPIVPVVRAAIGGLLVIVGLPVLYWFATIQSYSPPRGLAYFGFWQAALLCSAVTLLGGTTALRRPGISWARGIAAALSVFAIMNAAISTILWRDRAKLSQAELALARDIVDALEALPGYTNQRVRLIGTRSFEIRNWGASLGRTVFLQGETIFQEPYPLHGFFKDGFGNPQRFESPTNSDVSCPAFPAPGSVFMRDGVAYVCLAANGFNSY